MSGLESVKAQVPQKISYQKVSGITSVPICNLNTTKLAILAMKPVVATSGNNSHSKKKIKPYVSDKSNVYNKWWYNLAGGLFNSNMNTKYPSRTVPKK